MPSAGDEIRRVLNVFGPLPAEIRRELRPALRRVTEPVAAQARANASWSTRIPGAIRVTTSFTRKTAGVAITVSGRKAPHARSYEHLGRPGSFRHPVFGNRDRWVSQAARPFLFSAVAGADGELVRETGRVVEAAARKHGFR
ncbi:HK97 gp10 family phage protein [Microbispora triticiradicis]|uniref:HK97 gp10 family phage protein n=1 Tax=Microbispora triticiradicis TaxID=2200763 RepID=UPI001AD6268A|nr:HK97 gp10 family phage protein [Microbispora triticiradicis]MBO4272385.1 HK97 gp10 family phage protein [Microbispora triticiradicis]